ncbi:glycosyl transferase%2C family 2 [Streptococcus pneumoniae]|uniref:glycosyltransferase family 2 protein n=1 Tax=Streptococcus pneumoniae TaxID=1313 RepID=UPI0005DE7136|nr:glycosyltransferase family 2 protein [Streptococcus pneumoniae]CJG57286.1 glycosyl transferase%2C family 2 [Streptococcus pneumoniae]CJQ45699.1 glycosyl transferase%2C family 2 [Streptococcus pneumoniae]CKA47223.1 glycosyl transferase%2C family 2 [Streptococcus pneumoniae]COH07676.1 glycosyl transferase%2C family 2 [Streptococcus pneumoniae]
MDELISVIVPIYNTEKYLVECVESLRKQTYSNIEIILVDDGSTDASIEICDEFAEKDSRVKVFHKKNEGVAVARNFGIQQSNGQYVVIVDSDDVAVDRMIEVLYTQIKEKDVDIAVGNYYIYAESDGNFYYYITDDNYCVEVLSPQELIDRQAGAWQWNSSAFIVTVAKLYKKDLFKDVSFTHGRRFDDEASTHRIFLRSKKTVFINDNLYLYRRRSGSIMGTDFDLSWSRDLVEVFSKKISDLVLAGLDVSVMRIRFVNLLKDYKQTLEYHQLTDTEEYKDICFRLKLFFEVEQN